MLCTLCWHLYASLCNTLETKQVGAVIPRSWSIFATTGSRVDCRTLKWPHEQPDATKQTMKAAQLQAGGCVNLSATVWSCLQVP